LTSTFRKFDSYNRLTNGTIGLGGSQSIKNSTDIVSLLVMQLGGKIINSENNRAVLDESITYNGNYINPGEEALKFYCQFNDPTNQYYS